MFCIKINNQFMHHCICPVLYVQCICTMCIQKQEGTTPVMAAVENNSVELLQLLLAYNADLNQPKVG